MTNTNVISKVKDPIRTLRAIQEVAPSAIIAGGYHRDVYNDIPFSDVDIYVEFTSSENFNPLYTATWKNALNLDDDYRSHDSIRILGDDDDESYDADDSEYILTVFAMTKNKIKYNIIVVEHHPVDYIEEAFDFNICKTWCDGRRVHFSKEFMSDVENKTLTFTDKKMSLTGFAHSMDVHLPKIKHKYPNHKVVIPEVHADLHKKYQKNC